MPSRSHHSSARYGLLLGAAIVTVLSFGDAVIRASVSDREAVCVSVTVIGHDDLDPGSPGCIAQLVPESSSSSSVSSSSGSSVSSSSASESASSRTGEGTISGGRRYSINQSRWRVVRLLQQWAQRNTMHAAPGSSSSASSAGMWYDDAVRLMQQRGYIDTTNHLRLTENATRAEVAKIITVFSGATSPLPKTPSFDDAEANQWYVPFIERAALHSWMIGYDNCFGMRPCYFHPGAVISRAEVAAVFVRLFKLHPTNIAPTFSDVPSYAWYRQTVQTAADFCILQGNDGRVRPDDSVTRAELLVMFTRAMHSQSYRSGCVVATPASADTSIHPAAPSTFPSSDDICTGSVPMCIYDALRTDLGTLLGNSFGASLLASNAGAAARLPASEWMIWTGLFSLPIVGLFFLIRLSKNTDLNRL